MMEKENRATATTTTNTITNQNINLEALWKQGRNNDSKIVYKQHKTEMKRRKTEK